jgi:hypothetical protein
MITITKSGESLGARNRITSVSTPMHSMTEIGYSSSLFECQARVCHTDGHLSHVAQIKRDGQDLSVNFFSE